jgi:hypothetical protein
MSLIRRNVEAETRLLLMAVSGGNLDVGGSFHLARHVGRFGELASGRSAVELGKAGLRDVGTAGKIYDGAKPSEFFIPPSGLTGDAKVFTNLVSANDWGVFGIIGALRHITHSL